MGSEVQEALSGIEMAERTDAQGNPISYGLADAGGGTAHLPPALQQALAAKTARQSGVPVTVETVSIEPETFIYKGEPGSEKGDFAHTIDPGQFPGKDVAPTLIRPPVVASFPYGAGYMYRSPSVAQERQRVYDFYLGCGFEPKKSAARADAAAESNVRRIKVAIMTSTDFLRGKIIATERSAKEGAAERVLSAVETLKQTLGQDFFAVLQRAGITNVEFKEKSDGEPEAVKPRVPVVPTAKSFGIPAGPRTATIPDGVGTP